MADDFDPAEDIDGRLLRFVRETEPLVVLADPATVRLRGERRRARRRVKSAALVAAVVIGIGSWQLFPRFDGAAPVQGRGLPAASPSVAQRPAGDPAPLAEELLPPSALPGFPKLQWYVVPTSKAVAKFPLRCAIAPPPAVLVARADRMYAGGSEEIADYRIFQLADEAAGKQVAGQLYGQIKENCVHPTDARGSWPGGDAITYEGRSGADAVSVWMHLNGPFLAVLYVTGPNGLRGAKGESPASAPLPALCMDQSLERLALRTAGDPEAPLIPDRGFRGQRPAGEGASSPADSGEGKTQSLQHC